MPFSSSSLPTSTSPESAWFSYLSQVQLKHNQMEKSSKLSRLVISGLPLFLRRFLWLQWAFLLSSNSVLAHQKPNLKFNLSLSSHSRGPFFPPASSAAAPPPSPISPTSQHHFHRENAADPPPNHQGEGSSQLHPPPFSSSLPSPLPPSSLSLSFQHGFPGSSPFAVFFPFDPSPPSPFELGNPVFKAIMADLERTFPENELFKDSEAPLLICMKNILVAYARRNKEVGYCQGMNFIVAMFLLAGLQEHEAFNLIVLHVEYLMPKDFYSQQLFGLHVDQEVMQDLLQQHLPKFATHCRKHQTPFTMATMNWFLTGFSHVLPLNICFRIWDLYFFYGNQVFFWVSLAIFKMMEEELLKINNSGQIYMLFVQFTQTIQDADNLIKLAMKYQRSVTPSLLEKKRKSHFLKVQNQIGEHLQKVEEYQQKKS